MSSVFDIFENDSLDDDTLRKALMDLYIQYVKDICESIAKAKMILFERYKLPEFHSEADIRRFFATIPPGFDAKVDCFNEDCHWEYHNDDQGKLS